MQVLRLRGSQSTRTTPLRMTRFLSVGSLKKTRARAKTTADPCGITNKRQATADTTESANAGPSTASFAKCANDSAQDDTVSFGREFEKDKGKGKDNADLCGMTNKRQATADTTESAKCRS